MYSNNIKKYRLQQGLTLKDLSTMTNLSAGYLCHLEKGSRKNPSVKVMEVISKALNKTVGEIFFNGGDV